ncbi:MAG: hypothetical protein MZV63_00325 [Marinilabiliales bacterium]|nr:hypothetical protein [Marinilabiliales bacterium]
MTSPDRHHVFLPIPIYKCEGAGQITLAIVVDREGNVIKAASCFLALSTTKDPCLTETAVRPCSEVKVQSLIRAPRRNRAAT